MTPPSLALATLALLLLPPPVAPLLPAAPLPADTPASARAATPAPAPAQSAPAPAQANGVWPLVPAPPRVVRPFDPPAERWSAGHRGVDLLGAPGQRVRASLAGRVAFAGRIAGRGVVVVDHGALRTTYEPVTPAVRRGDVVGTGEQIGALEILGSHCLPHVCLHWGLRRGEEYLDPLTLVGAAPGPVRLLPLGSMSAPVRPGDGPARTPDVGGPW